MATLLVVTQRTKLVDLPKSTKFLICLSVWIIPSITATTATALGTMTAVSGNWCWISAQRTDLRYGLTHGWRFAIILATLGMYVYVYFYLSRHFRSLAVPFGFTHREQDGDSGLSGQTQEEDEARPYHQLESGGHAFVQSDPYTEIDRVHARVESGVIIQHDVFLDSQRRDDGSGKSRYAAGFSPYGSAYSHHNAPVVKRKLSAQQNMKKQLSQTERDIKRMLLLNGYPIMYIILWIPGIANRIMEATGRTSNKEALNILQCSTQFIGFANALTYGLNTEIRKKLSKDLFGWTQRRRG